MSEHDSPKQIEASAASADERHLRTDHLMSDLGGRTVRGGALTIGSQGLRFLVTTGSTVVLARLLMPEDYGLVGMVAVVTGFVSMFKDMGLSTATIQKAEISSEQVSTLFWLNALLGFAAMLLMIGLAPAIAWFYKEPRLSSITIAFSVNFIFGGLMAQHQALLRRQMRFGALALAEMVSLFASIAVAIALAWRGAGYWALVFSNLALGFSYAVVVWGVSGWLPGLPQRSSGVRSMLIFGRNLTGFQIVNYLSRNLDNMLIGRFWGSAQLGLYARAYQLLLLPIEQINTPIAAVAVPALSRLADEPERYRQAYLRILEKIAIVTMPGMAFMIATSDWLVLLLLGPRWMGVSQIFALLGIVGLVQPIANTVGWLFITQGRTAHMFQWGMIGSTIMIAGIVAGLPWGAIGVAAAYSAVFLLIIVPLLFWFVGREGPVRAADFYRTIAPTACASLSVLGALLLFRRFVQVAQPLFGIALSFVIMIVITLLLMLLLPGGRRALHDLKQSLTLLMERKREREPMQAVSTPVKG
ncbi:MAG TPA: lipopolysaccharide biosynthesis protein [Pyrinomonadaceae bacterium]|jgi:PST family polysaccharide transporter